MSSEDIDKKNILASIKSNIIIIIFIILSISAATVFLVHATPFENSPDTQDNEQIIGKEETRITEGFVKAVIYRKDPDLSGYLCKPESTGKLPAVIYNHGGTGDQIGGAPEETCKALKDAGYVGFSPIRRIDIRDDRDLNDIYSALDYLKGLDYVDTEKLGIIGFSRGGYLTYLTISGNSDFKTAVILAAAPPEIRMDFTQWQKTLIFPYFWQLQKMTCPLNKIRTRIFWNL